MKVLHGSLLQLKAPKHQISLTSYYFQKYLQLSYRAIARKNRGILVQKLWGEKKLSKSVFGYFKTKKKKSTKNVPMAIKLEGGG